MKPTVYFDTTFPSYMYDTREELKTYVDETNKWWKTEKQNYIIYTSDETLNELGQGDYPTKLDTLKFISQIDILPFHPKIIEIANIYIANYLMPRVLEGDALHLAYASFYKIDYLLTWNCEHLANANKKQHIRIINTRLNLYIPEIVTPMVLITEEKND